MPIVNYIREHEWFIEYAANEGLTPNDIALYDAILRQVNRRAEGNYWPDDFTRIRNDVLLLYCRMGFDAMARSRNKLKQKGIIDFIPGNRNSEAPAYKIEYKCLERESYPQGAGVYPFSADKSTGKNADKTTDKSTDKPTDKSADIYKDYTGESIPNQNGEYTHTFSYGDSNSAGARGRLAETYVDSAGNVQKCRFDGAFLTSDRARAAVAQRILDRFDGTNDTAGNPHTRLCDWMKDGMPPEILEDEIGDFRFLSEYMGKMAGIFFGRHYEERRDQIERDKCLRQAKGNQKLADMLYRYSGRYVPEAEEG